MKKLISFLTLIFVSILLINATDRDNRSEAIVGEPAPEFSVVDANGNMHSLSDYEGKYVILEWLNHGCPFVRKHYDGNNMQQMQNRYTEEGVVWLSVVSSAPGTQGYMEPDETLETMIENNAAPTAILLDVDGAMGRAYDARVTPHMYIISPDGTLEYNGAIDDKPTARLRDLEDAHNYVDSAMASLRNDEPVEVRTSTPYGCTVKYQ